jgi:dihydroorotase-like cyclic amidohydrolase
VLGDGWLTPSDVVRLTARGPAETFGLVSKGRVEPGADADLVVVDPAGTTELSSSASGPSTARSPYGERRLRGAVTHVLRRGGLLVSEGGATDAARQGGGAPVERQEPIW